MIKRDKNFRLPKEIKTKLAFMPKDKANNYRKLMIEAIIKGSIPIKSTKKNDKSDKNTGLES